MAQLPSGFALLSYFPRELSATPFSVTDLSPIGKVLRHRYENISAPVMWALVRDDLPPLERVCQEELAAEQAREPQKP